MQANHQENQSYVKINADRISGQNRTYENCKFINCDFSFADLSRIAFIDCLFENSNLSLCDISNSGFQNILFNHCKLSGVNFSKALDFLFELHFENCILDNAVFYKKKNKKSKFLNCSMVETDLTECDLTDAKFTNCNLSGAFFSRTIIKGADLRTSYNFIIDPEINNVKKARFSLHGTPGLLTKYQIIIE